MAGHTSTLGRGQQFVLVAVVAVVAAAISALAALRWGSGADSQATPFPRASATASAAPTLAADDLYRKLLADRGFMQDEMPVRVRAVRPFVYADAGARSSESSGSHRISSWSHL